MSGIVLSASVRQNLLSLQSTADLLATTQNRLSTGKKVNTALDNPTNYFTAASLDSRASDISNLLDGIGNGVQVLQAANTGITSLQKLVDTAKSIANQVLQAPTGYSPKSTVSSTAAVLGTAANLVDGVSIKAGDVLAIADTGGGTVTFGAVAAPVKDTASQDVRKSLVKQYNDIITQISTTAQDSSFNGINLLFGDNLKLTFDETGKSTLNITGVTFDAAGLGLGQLTAGTDFLDNSSANTALALLGSASTVLRTEASALGSNLSVVQIRQDFNKNLINVLQSGASNLTLADANEEAANSQALSTRQSIAVSALSLANQSQQSVLQLLR